MSGQWFVDWKQLGDFKMMLKMSFNPLCRVSGLLMNGKSYKTVLNGKFQSPMSGQWFVDNISSEVFDYRFNVSIPYVGSVVC